MKYKILNRADNTFGGKVYESLIDGKKLIKKKTGETHGRETL